MIYFCEDCGKKNVLDTTHLKNGYVEFRCTSCTYLNSYAIKTGQNTLLEKAKHFFTEISEYPEILGSFLFHAKTGLLVNQMPGMLKKTDLDILGKRLIKNHLICLSEFKDVTETTLVISDKNMITRKIDPDVFVIIVAKHLPLVQPVSEKLAALSSRSDPTG